MDQYVLLAEIENTFFFYHADQQYSKKEATYNIYRAMEHIKLLNNKDSAVVVFNILNDDTMDVVAIQHKESSSPKLFDKSNLEETFKFLKIIDTPRNILFIYYYNEKDTYETTVINGLLPYVKEKQIEAIEYVEFQGEPSVVDITLEKIVEDGNLNQPLQIEITSDIEPPNGC